MTGKDVLTLLLCTFGYDRNIRINVERLGYEEPCYDVHAENADGDVYEQCDSEGLMFHIYEIIAYMTEYNCYINDPSDKTRYMDLHKLRFESNWWGVPPKYVLDQKQREKTVVAKDERERQIKAQIAEKASSYMRGRAMALSFKPLTLKDVRDAFKNGAEEMERLIDDSMWWKSATGEDLPGIDREVIALTNDGKIVFAHRPPEYWDGKDISTGKVTRRYPKRYGAGQWNAPDIKYWLDIQIPIIDGVNG